MSLVPIRRDKKSYKQVVTGLSPASPQAVRRLRFRPLAAVAYVWTLAILILLLSDHPVAAFVTWAVLALVFAAVWLWREYRWQR